MWKDYRMQQLDESSQDPIPSTQQEKLRYEALLANIGQGLVVIEKLGTIIMFNKTAESLLGWKAEEAIGKNLQDILTINYENGQGPSASPLGGQPSYYLKRKDQTKFPAAITTSSYVLGS